MKSETITFKNETFLRIPIRTHVITEKDSIIDVAKKYAGPQVQKGDMLFISERVVAISQGRAYRISDIHPSSLANFLVKFVHKSPYGIGLGSPWTMELALREAGAARILFAAGLSALTKPFGIKGVFYRVVGKNINAIDGPCDYTLPPYNKYAKLGPKDPDKVAREISEALGAGSEQSGVADSERYDLGVVIIDANDLGVNILGRSHLDINKDMCAAVFKDNPLGQSSEQTPLCIVRKMVK